MSVRRALVALSGGVDSSVAAARAVSAGFEVDGVTLLLWGGERQGRSCSTADASAARQAADSLGVPLHVADLRDEFDRHVIGPFVSAAHVGVTENPCVSCNRAFKLDWLFSFASGRGFDVVVTGHHANVVEVDGSSRLARSVDVSKDQSYVLYRATSEQLARLWFPLGLVCKEQVRAEASGLGLPAATVPDSMDLCFSPSELLGSGTPAQVVDRAGVVVGSVPSLERVTVGQRRGLRVSLGVPVYVVDVDATSRRVVVGSLDELSTDTVRVRDWFAAMSFDELSARVAAGSVSAQFSAHGRPVPVVDVVVDDAGNVVTVRFASPVRRQAPGQHVVLYASVVPDIGSGPVDVVAGGGPAA